MESRKMVQMILFAKQKQRHTHRTNIWILSREGGWDEWGGWN